MVDKNSFFRLLQLAILIAATVLAYAEGLKGDYEFDDGTSILENKGIQIGELDFRSLWQAAMSGESGTLKRPISYATFALNFYSTGTDPFYFKATNLAIHIATGLLLLLLCRLLLQALYLDRTDGPNASARWYISLAVTALWLLHPIQLTTVLYIVQRMTSLSAFFMIGAAVLYTWGRLRLIANQRRGPLFILLAFTAMWPAAMLCKETGVLTPAYLFLIEALIQRFRGSQRTRRGIAAIFGLSLALPLLVGLVALAMHPSWIMTPYAYRDFTLTERLLTETRVLWFYVRLIAAPQLAKLGLYHDDIAVSTSFFQPWTTAISVIAWICVAGLAVWAVRRAPVLSFGLLWFLVGHSLESTVVALDLAHEHRNYLPSFGLVFALAHYTLTPLHYPKLLRPRQMAIIGFIGLLTVLTTLRSHQWAVLLDHAYLEVQNHPLSVRANYQMGRLYLKLYQVTAQTEYLSRAREHWQHITKLNRYTKVGHFGLIHTAYLGGSTPNKETISTLEERLRNRAFEPVDVALLRNLVQCQTYQYCRLKDEDVMRLLEAAWHNPRIARKARAEVAALAGVYAIEKMGSPIEAEHYFLLSRTDDPNEPARYLSLASLYELFGRKQEAIALIKQAQGLDRLGKHQADIQARLERLSSGKK